MKRITMLIVIVCSIFECVYGDEILLKNGKKLSGRLLDQQDDVISFEVHLDSVTFSAILQKDDVLEIEFDNTDHVDESALFALQQKTKGLELYNGRWLPKKHVENIKSSQKNMYTAQKVALFSIQFFIFLIIGFAVVLGVDVLHYQWRKFKLNRIVKREKADHRLHRRIPLKYPIKVAPKGKEQFDAQTNNISLGGLLFSTDMELNLADHIDIELMYSDGSIYIAGLIVRKEKDVQSEMYNLGVSFIGLDQEKRQKIAYLIAHPEKSRKAVEQESQPEQKPPASTPSKKKKKKKLHKQHKVNEQSTKHEIVS